MMLVYNSIPDGKDVQPDYTTPWLETMEKRDTTHVFEYPGVASSKFFQFRTKNMRRPGTVAYGGIGEIQITTSRIFYFGLQGKARVHNN